MSLTKSALYSRVLDFEPPQTLLERCDVYRALWNQQTLHMAT